MRWMLVLLLVFLLFNRAGDWLRKIGLGRLPGDLRFRLFGREWFLPVTTTILLSFIASMIAHLL